MPLKLVRDLQPGDWVYDFGNVEAVIPDGPNPTRSHVAFAHEDEQYWPSHAVVLVTDFGPSVTLAERNFLRERNFPGSDSMPAMGVNVPLNPAGRRNPIVKVSPTTADGLLTHAAAIYELARAIDRHANRMPR